MNSWPDVNRDYMKATGEKSITGDGLKAKTVKFYTRVFFPNIAESALMSEC